MTVTSDLVEIVKIIENGVVALAWPVVVLTIALVFRRYLAEVIARTIGIELGNLKVSFERKLETAEEKVSAIGVPEQIPDAPVDQVIQPESLPPEYIVLQAWVGVETELYRLAQRAGISLKRGRSPLYIIRFLQSRELLDRQTASLLDDLRGMRNAVVHPNGEVPITPDQAIRFRDLADVALQRLHRLPGQGDAS